MRQLFCILSCFYLFYISYSGLCEQQEYNSHTRDASIQPDMLDNILHYVDLIPDNLGIPKGYIPDQVLENIKSNEAVEFFYHLAVHKYWLYVITHLRNQKKDIAVAKAPPAPVRNEETHKMYSTIHSLIDKKMTGDKENMKILQKAFKNIIQQKSLKAANESWLYQPNPVTNVNYSNITTPINASSGLYNVFCGGSGLGSIWKATAAGSSNLPPIIAMIIEAEELTGGKNSTWWVVMKVGIGQSSTGPGPAKYWVMGIILSPTQRIFSIRGLPGSNLPNVCGSTIGVYTGLGADCSMFSFKPVSDPCTVRAFGLDSLSSIYANGMEGWKVS